MAADVIIEIRADSADAVRDILRLQNEIKQLNTQFGSTGRSAAQAGGLVDQFGRPLGEAAGAAQTLNRAISITGDELREIATTSQRSADALDKIGDEASQTTRQLAQLNQSLIENNRSTGILTAGFGSLRNVLGGIGFAVVTHQLGALSVNAVQAAGSLEQLTRATTQIEGSAEAAEARIAALVEVANLPGLQFEPLVRYSNRLRAAGIEGQDVDTILLSVGQTIVSLGGSAATAELAMEQLIQAIAAGKVDMRDFRTIIQQIPGFLEAMGDVHGVAANIDGLKEAFDNTGGSIRDLVIPTFEELSRRFEAPPSDSYIVAMDTLENAFMLASASIGSLFLPTIVQASQGLTTFFEAIRAGTGDLSTLPEPIQEIVRGAQALWDGLQNVYEGIESALGPSVREFASQLAGLLGEVLSLAGALYTALEPVLRGVAAIVGTVVAAMAQLVDHITLLIGGLTTAVNWVSQFWTEEERAAVSTEKLAGATEKLAEAQEKLNSSGDVQREKLKALQTELANTEKSIADYTQRLKEADEAGISDASTQQLERLLESAKARIPELKAEIEALKEAYGGASAALNENATAVEKNEARLKDLQTELVGVTAKVADYEDRLANATSSGSIEQLQRFLAAAKDEAAGLQTEIDQLTDSLSNTDAAAEATENFSLELAKLKANAEDTRETLSETVNIQQLGANYSAAIAASDAYYSTLIANAEAALAQEEENSEAYQKIETDLFNLRREQVQARERLTREAAEIGEAESKKRIATAESENQALQEAGEETARALAESQKQQTAAAEAEQKRLTDAHEAGLREREAAQQAADQRIVDNSEQQLGILQNVFENALPAGVDAAYSSIQQATIEHYEILKDQARSRITDEDALNAELVSLDRQRNAALQENHRSYLQRIASDAKDLLGERTDGFREASAEILHNWSRTVAEFERRLREADTEEALEQIQGEFTEAQREMLQSLQSVLIELGFTAEQAAEIMVEVLRTAETESDSFADKVISAFQRLGREARRETRQQNREIARSYRELVSEIENILSGVTDFFLEIAEGESLESAFKNLGTRLGNALVRELESNVAGKIASIVSPEGAEVATQLAGTAAGDSTAGVPAGGAGITSVASSLLPSILGLVTSTAALAVLVPAAVGAATYYIGRQVAGSGTDLPTNRQGRPIQDEPRQRRGETQAGFQSRLARETEREANQTRAAEFQRLSDPRAPLRRFLQESDVFTGDLAVFAQGAVSATEVDPTGQIDLPGLVGRLQEIIGGHIEDLGVAMERAAEDLESASPDEFPTALQNYIDATREFYQTQIDNINETRRLTGDLSFGDSEGLARELQNALNQAFLGDTRPTRGFFQQQARDAERERQENVRTEDIARAQYGDEAYDAEVSTADDGGLAGVIEGHQRRCRTHQCIHHGCSDTN